MPLLILIGFGLVALSSAFLVFVFFRAWNDGGFREDRRYRLAAGSLAIGKVGIFLWALNPILVALKGRQMPLPVLVAASALILVAAVSLIGSTALGGDKKTLKVFLAAALVWTVLSVILMTP